MKGESRSFPIIGSIATKSVKSNEMRLHKARVSAKECATLDLGCTRQKFNDNRRSTPGASVANMTAVDSPEPSSFQGKITILLSAMLMDIVSPACRSRMMKSVKQRHTAPELIVRQTLRQLGVAYRVHNRSLPGSPDIANRSRKWAIFVNGCFWHGHRNCPKTVSGRAGRIPESNRLFWQTKLVANRRRDAQKILELRSLGFRVKVIWECQLRRFPDLSIDLRHFLLKGDPS